MNKVMWTYHIKAIVDLTMSDNRFSVIASYKSQLETLARMYDVELIEVFESSTKSTVQGIFGGKL